MLRHSFATRKIEGGMPAEVLMIIMGHKDVETTINTYFDAFAEYKNKFEQQTYNYYELQGLTFDIVDKSFIILQELNTLLEKIKISHLEDIDKQKLILTIQNIDKKYGQRQADINTSSNVIMFPVLSR